MDGQLIMLVQHSIFRLRDEFQVCEVDVKTLPILRFKTRQMVAINVAYNAADLEIGDLVWAIPKRGLRSLIRDTFKILDPAGEEIGTM